MVFEFKNPEPFRHGQQVTLPDGRQGKITTHASDALLIVKIDGSIQRVAISEADLRKFN